MNTVNQIEQLTAIAQRLGYRIRYDNFGGTGGGRCEVAGRKWLFIDLALSSIEQLEQIKTVLSAEPLLTTATTEDAAVAIRRAA